MAGGRLWVVCRRCEVWNLAPFEERFSAMEDAERLYRATRTRVATGEIGLARLRDGPGSIDLVRIGKPLRPEFAAWRYGERFITRHRRHSFAMATGGVGLMANLLGSTALVASGVGAAVMAVSYLVQWRLQRHTREVRLTLPQATEPVLLKGDHLQRVRLLPTGDDFALRLVHDMAGRPRFVETTTLLDGDDAMRAARVVLPVINATEVTDEASLTRLLCSRPSSWSDAPRCSHA